MDFDLTVVGGGLAGVCAAIAAARLGATVALINNRPVLGGNSSSEVRVWVCGATAHGSQKYARETGIMGELFLENQYRNPEGNPVFWDHVLLDAVRAEPNIRLFLNTDVRAVEASGPDDQRKIHAVTGWQMGSETELRFTSPLFVDASGDGLMGYLAGAWFREGRESRAVYGEEWAPESADSVMLGSTILFYTKDAGERVRYVPPTSAKRIAATGILESRRFSATDNGCDYWWIEWGGELDPVNDNEAIRDELWAVIFGIWDHIKNSGEFDAENLTLEWVGSLPGKREYRRFVGDHVLVQDDVMHQRPFEDRVAFGGWSIDLHPPGGMFSGDAGSKHLYTSGPYHVPWRCLYSKNVENMLMAGRTISVSHVAFGTTRVMATCAAIGEAVGTGAALALRLGVSPRELGSGHRALLHSELLRQDAAVLGVEWNDPRDLALEATASASSTLVDLSTGLRDQRHGGWSAEGELLSLTDVDLGLHLPVDPALGRIEIAMEATHDTVADFELWTTARGENHIPVERIDRRSVPVAQGRQVVAIDFDYAPGSAEDVVVVIRRDVALSVLVEAAPAPFGVMGLISRTPRYDAPEHAQFPPTNAWSAIELRHKSVAFRASVPTRAYHPANVIGGHARPYGGPRLWASEPLPGNESAWIALTWNSPRAVGSIDIIFNDNVDEDIVNLHHHRTPFEVMPELVRHYDVEVEGPGQWRVVETVRDNRRRLRRHAFSRIDGITAVRLTIHSTHGSRWAMVHGIRVFGPEAHDPHERTDIR